MSQQQPFLRIVAATQADAYVIRIERELDAARCPELDAALADADRSRARRIVVDLDRLNWIDADGLETLLRASRRSASGGNRLQLRAGRGDVALMFRLMMPEETPPATAPVRPPAGVAKRENADGSARSAIPQRSSAEAPGGGQNGAATLPSLQGQDVWLPLTDPERLFDSSEGF